MCKGMITLHDYIELSDKLKISDICFEKLVIQKIDERQKEKHMDEEYLRELARASFRCC